MWWAVLLLLGTVLLVHWIEYKRSIQEYTFANPALLDRHDELRTLMGEKTPLAVEIGPLPWRPEVVAKSAWSVTNATTGEQMPSATWNPDIPIGNPSELAAEMGLTTGLGDIAEGRALWWLPQMFDASVNVLQKDAIVGLSWVGAERRWIGCSHGGPLTLWLVHSRYRRFLPTGGPEADINPWTLTVAEAPWIGRVQFVEVTVKPGWCIGLPAHWGFAVKTDNTAWWWSMEQHSVLSWMLCNYSPPDTESWMPAEQETPDELSTDQE